MKMMPTSANTYSFLISLSIYFYMDTESEGAGEGGL